MANDERIKKLQLLLKDLFQFENNDLDFGIYRIINIKRKEISEFIDKELFDIIKEKIKTVEDNTELQKSLEIIENEIKKTFGCDIQEAKTKYAETPKVKEYINKEKELNVANKENEIEEEIYDDIINFFSRYYNKGDIISKKRYSKDNKYAIPYNGEEVYLYWANNDQYYVKTAENFKNYSFKAGELKINFEIESEEVDVEKNNIKDEKDKFFIFKDADYDAKSKKLVIKFGYRELSDEEKQEISESSDKKKIGKGEVNGYNLTCIQEKIGIYGLSDLQKKHIKIDGEKSEKSELEWHLNKYMTKNTSDYFIHKNLKKFLNQELDFYIKNELLHIDDIDSKENLDISLNRVKAFKEITLKIIEFLSQIEDFQKKLWKKKKFVVSTDYCITLDNIDQKYYPKILDNKEQLKEWRELFSFNVEDEEKKFKGTLHEHGGENKKVEVLKQNPTVVLDTKFFEDEFKYQILSEIDHLDERTNGILINSENFQALSLLLKKYEKKINCCYIDPPYNTGENDFLYKDYYQSSSWLCMLKDRLLLTKDLITDSGFTITHIDEHEFENLRKLNEFIFGQNTNSGPIIWDKRNPKGDAKGISYQHEYINFSFNNYEYFKRNNLTLQKKKTNGILILNKAKELINKYRRVTEELREEFKKWLDSQVNLSGGEKAYNQIDDNGGVFQSVSMAWPNKKKAPEGYFIPLIHPTTKKPCPVPERGWRNPPETMRLLLEQNLIIFGKDETVQPRRKYLLKNNLLDNVPSLLYYGGSDDALFKNMGINFENPKPIYVAEYLLQIPTLEGKGIVIDYFAGSGTTGHAVLKLNKSDGGNRKFILVEMGQYFDTVLKRRILKVIYSDKWKEGKPQDNDGFKRQIIKYQTLEQYEDSLNNIDFMEPNKLVKESKDYNIKYMLEFESKDNNVFLNLDSLDNPFEYKLKIENNKEPNNIDLVETFNYIAGIYVKSIQRMQDKKVDYIIVKGQRNDKDVIIIWRNKNEDFDPKRDKVFVETEILKEEYDEIFVNGNSLIDAKSVDEVLKSNMLVE